MSAVLLTGCGSRKKTDAVDSVIKISTAPEPTATPDPKTVDPDAVTTNGNLTMVNEYLAENGGAELGSAAVTPTPAQRLQMEAPVILNRIHQVQIHPMEIVQMVLTVAMDRIIAVIPDIPMKTATTASMMIQGKETMMENKAKKPLELYIHVPFCVKKCDYCDFLSGPAGKERQAEYFQALQREVASVPDFPDREITTVFIGGGTPSVPDPALIGAVLDQIRNKFLMAPDAEITIEANPGTLYKEKLEDYLEHGVNRLSLGLQSPQNRELKILGRIHTWEEFLESFSLAREAGFSNINIDLMSAIPDQTYEGWEKNLRTVAALGPEHISAYSLIVEEGTPFWERDLKLPDEDTEYSGCMRIRQRSSGSTDFISMRSPIMQKKVWSAGIIRAIGREQIIWVWDLGHLHSWIIYVFPIQIIWKNILKTADSRRNSAVIWSVLTRQMRWLSSCSWVCV